MASFLERIRLHLSETRKKIISQAIRAFFTVAENIVFSVNTGTARSYTVMAGITAVVFFLNVFHVEQTGIIRALGISGGPESSGIPSVSTAFDPASPVESVVSDSGSGLLATLSGWQEKGGTSTQGLGVFEASTHTIMTYDAQNGDTVQSVAQKFGISENTVRWVNNVKQDTLSPGQRLLILPLSGVLHHVGEGESIESVAGMYNVAPARVRAANHLGDAETAFVGETLIIPGGDVKQSVSFALATTTSGMQGNAFFKIPTTGWNWGKLHYNNAVDIAHDCGTPVYASASGFVSKAISEGWNDGYGKYVAVDHGNGIETLYAHLSALFVSPGAYVNAGDLLGAIGNTGRVDGVTGCHLHFEVHGAPNPFARQ